jgi:uncharacterized membrane protein
MISAVDPQALQGATMVLALLPVFRPVNALLHTEAMQGHDRARGYGVRAGMSWTGFMAVFAAFFVTHSIPLRPAVKARLTARLGQRGFGIAYGLLSLVMLALLIGAAGRAPFLELWAQMPWQRHAVQVGMLGACVILALSIGRPNPLSFGGGRSESFDPARPGIVGWVRHPILLVLALWAGLHVLPNGDLAHVILFGVLGAFALLGARLIDRRKQREMGLDRWLALRAAIAKAPRFGTTTAPGVILIRLGLGVVLYALLLWAHPAVIGVPAG